MKRFISIVFAIAIVCSHTSVFCQNSSLEFIENKGQWDPSITFKGVMNNGAFFLQGKGFTVALNKSEDLEKLAEFYHGIPAPAATATSQARAVLPTKDDESVVVHSHSYSVQFVNAGTPLIVPDKVIKSYNNYFIGNDPSKWKGNCKIYQAVTYKNMYKGIDVRYYTSEGKLKYDLIVQPGADLSKVAMRYEGADGLEVKNDQLIIKTSVGEVREMAPYAFQVVDGLKKEIGCKFRVIGKTVTFDLENYSKSATLVIDPTLIFSTFTGSSSDNWGYTATYGPDGAFYAGGIVFGTGFKTTPGAYKTDFQGAGSDEEPLAGYDIGIMKFNADGTSVSYATYVGGSGNEVPQSLIVDSQGELVIAGRTNSINYPTKAANLGVGGKYDIILTKLNAAGSDIVGSRKIGGTENDGVNIRPKYAGAKGAESIRRNYGDDSRSEVILDNGGDILLASCTQSVGKPDANDNFPVVNAFQKTAAGKQDGVFIKVSSDLNNILVCTYLGGSENDAAFVLAINPIDNKIYVGGNTVSQDLPGDKTGVLHSTFQAGETDGFVSIISADGLSLLKTSYMGTAGNDMLYGIQFDKFGYPYIMGTSSLSWPVINAAYSQAGGKQFIAKLKPDLSGFEYSTIFGTNSSSPNLSPIAFLVDRCENVYVSGWGGQINNGNGQGYPNAGTNGMSTTPDAIQPTTDGSDFYFFVLERNAANRLYASFFGQSGGSGEHVDGGTSRFDRNGVIYQALCANCGNTPGFPTTPGVAYPRNGSNNCNLAAVKIAFNLAGVAGSVRSSIQGSVNDTTGCVPLSVDFTDTIGAGQSYAWNFGDGSADKFTTTPSISHTFMAVGTYRVRLISTDSSKCNISDTAYTTIKVRTFKAILDFTPKKLAPCNAFDYKFGNNSTVSPAARAYSSTSFKWDFGDNTAPVIAGLDSIEHSFPGPGVYKVTLALTDTNFCNAPTDTVKLLRIATNVKAEFSTPKRGCAPYDAFFDNISAGGEDFFWDFGDNTTSNATSPTHTYSIPGTYLVKLKAVDSATCNIVDTTSFPIIISSKPIASFTFSPDPPQENTPIEFFNSSIGATNYLWKFGDGDSLLTASVNSIKHIYNETDSFHACLIALNPIGCPDTACRYIDAKVLPLLDVPNAFTPNNDGINDKVFVRGFGIMKMLWKIYNRWGTVVFETADRTQGWDGIYKGSLQPNEVYHYVLDVQYSDKSKFQKKGDITLLR